MVNIQPPGSDKGFELGKQNYSSMLRCLYYFSAAFFCLSKLLCYYVKKGFFFVKLLMGCTRKCSKSSQTFQSQPNNQSHPGLRYLKK